MSASETQTAGDAQRAAESAPRPGRTARATTGLEPFRRHLDELDEQIARLFGERFQICREIALYKRKHEIPMMQPGRVEEVRARYLARGTQVKLPEDFTKALFELMIGATCKLEDELIDAPPEAVAEARASRSSAPDPAPEGAA